MHYINTPMSVRLYIEGDMHVFKSVEYVDGVFLQCELRMVLFVVDEIVIYLFNKPIIN